MTVTWIFNDPDANYASFIASFPEFQDTSLYPQAQVEFWMPAAEAQLSSQRFGSQFYIAAFLFVAHNVVLSAREVRTAANGGIVGTVTGPVTSKSLDKLSQSFSSDTSIQGAGFWNATTYGQRLYKMMRSYAAGPFYITRRGRRC